MQRHFPDLPRTKPALSKAFRIPVHKLDQVFDRGVRAQIGASGSRSVGGSSWQWAWARLYKFLLVDAGKVRACANDPDLLLHKRRVQLLARKNGACLRKSKRVA